MSTPFKKNQQIIRCILTCLQFIIYLKSVKVWSNVSKCTYLFFYWLNESVVLSLLILYYVIFRFVLLDSIIYILRIYSLLKLIHSCHRCVDYFICYLFFIIHLLVKMSFSILRHIEPKVCKIIGKTPDLQNSIQKTLKRHRKDINFRWLFLVFLGFWFQNPKNTRKTKETNQKTKNNAKKRNKANATQKGNANTIATQNEMQRKKAHKTIQF